MNYWTRILLDLPGPIWITVEKYLAPQKLSKWYSPVMDLYRKNALWMFGDHNFHKRDLNPKYFDGQVLQGNADHQQKIMHVLIEPHQVTTQHILNLGWTNCTPGRDKEILSFIFPNIRRKYEEYFLNEKKRKNRDPDLLERQPHKMLIQSIRPEFFSRK